VLLGGFAAVFAAVQLTKAGIDRPRPPEALVSVDSPAYPSGHSAYGTAYVTMAVIASRVLPNLASRAALVLISIVVAALIGASRIYLGVHWFSDVAGGIGLGLGVFASFGVVALLVSYIRHNQPGSPPERHDSRPVPERAG
jgi:undecaprenyl-diphosphatase